MADIPTHVQIEENRSFVRDTQSRAIINVDRNALKSYRAHREQILKDKQALVTANTEISNLKQQVQELRELVQTCLSRPFGVVNPQ